MAHKIGVLALQGDWFLHAEALHKLAVEARQVRMPGDLKGLSGLVIPGGESTALLKLARPVGLLEELPKFVAGGGSIFGTCAGAILLARTVTDPAQESLGLIDITVRRNGYGRQLDSTDAVGQRRGTLGTGPLPMTLIRAPRITAVGKAAEVLAEYSGEPVLVRQERVLAATFHPELTEDTDVYRYWFDHMLQ
ncbi:MAG TPA: pyridoxal 5'-phosphate synthase glutaminase subunit PdxT [Candidatus Saccharimonadia bacterium]|nr:pyridoxal 5'-phosphate synthase glutaminase subunit PdxT [Candidatus Saccharimonadia bacterium]